MVKQEKLPEGVKLGVLGAQTSEPFLSLHSGGDSFWEMGRRANTEPWCEPYIVLSGKSLCFCSVLGHRSWEDLVPSSFDQTGGDVCEEKQSGY